MIYIAMRCENIKVIYQNKESEFNTNDFSLYLKQFLSSDCYESIISFDGNKEIDLKDTVHVSLNIKNVGVFTYFFKSSNSNKNELISIIEQLKTNNNLEPFLKASRFIAYSNKCSPAFLIYQKANNGCLSESALNNLVDKYPVIYLENTVNDDSKETKKHLSIKDEVIDFFKTIKKEFFSIAFVTISSLIVVLSSLVGINYSMLNNNINLFFFACALVGAVLSGFVHYDSFNNKKIISKIGFLLLLASIIGVLLSMGGYKIFCSMQEDKLEVTLSTKQLLIYAFAIGIVVDILAALISRLIRIATKKEEE